MVGVLCAVAAVVGTTISTVACGREPGQRELVPVSLPDMSRSDALVQAQTRDRHAALMQKIENRAPDPELAVAYGEFGMLLQAAEYFDAAEPAYRDARALAPTDARWPYYLGHVYRRKGDVTKAVESFRQALEWQDTNVPTLLWLSRTLIELGSVAEAQALLVRAQSGAPRETAVLAELGQVALAQRDYQRAASFFSEALALDPTLLSLHAPLATAYRGLGEAAKAEEHARLWKNTEVPIADPLMDRVAAMVESGVSYETRGVRAFEAGQWAEAAALFLRGIERTGPETPLARSLHHKRGLALHLGGDVAGAVKEFEQVIASAPADGLDEPAAQAHYGLAIVIAAQKRDADAIEHLSKALNYSPAYAQAMVVRGDLLRRNRRFEESLMAYREAVKVDAMRADARLGYGVSLVKLKRDVEARGWFEEAVRAQPDRPELAHALARVLAAAPDSRARDPRRAMAVLQPLIATRRTTDLGETMAMALAGAGEFAEAASLQRDLLRAAERAGLRADLPRMQANLRLYEQKQPCRTPWSDEDAIHSPGP